MTAQTVTSRSGSVTMSANGDVTAPSVTSVNAGLDANLASALGSVAAAAVNAGRDVNVAAAQNVTLGTVTAGRSVTADAAGGDLTAGSVRAETVNLSALGTLFVPPGTLHVGSLMNLGADTIRATVNHTGTLDFLQANAANRGGGPATLVELSITSPLGVQFGTFSALDAALRLNSALGIANGFIENRAAVTNPVTFLLMDQNDRRPQPADIQLYAPSRTFRLDLDGRVLFTDAFVVHHNELTHSAISFDPGIQLDLRHNVERGLAIAEDAATAGGARERAAQDAGELVSYSQTPVALPDCTRAPLPPQCR
jgi:hypothetical protein